MIVYVAAPLFSKTERMLNQEVQKALLDVCDVYLPQTDGTLVETAVASGEPEERVCRLAYEGDIKAIRACDVLVAVLDGRVPDEGVCIEIGFAKALGKHIVGFKSDIRRAVPWGNNPMIDGCVDIWVSDAQELRNYIRAWRLLAVKAVTGK